MSDAKRESERIELTGALHGEVMVFQNTAIRQISRGGMQVETSFPLQVDSLHDFRLTLGARSVVVKGRVVHCRISEFESEGVVYLSGVEFLEMSEPVRHAISDFVERVRSVRSTHLSDTP